MIRLARKNLGCVAHCTSARIHTFSLKNCGICGPAEFFILIGTNGINSIKHGLDNVEDDMLLWIKNKMNNNIIASSAQVPENFHDA
jgi:hypothetical protein